MKNINWNEIEEAKDFEKVAPGGYVCGITAVDDVENKEYLKLEYDIADGPFKNYYRELYESKGFWGASFVKSYKEKALPFFKAFITAIQNSNKGFVFKNDPQSLKRKLIGLVLGEEEYRANDGSKKTRLYVAEVHSVDKIHSGDFKVPELKKIEEKFTPNSNTFDSINDIPTDNDLPF